MILPDLPPINQVGSGVKISTGERRGMARKRYTAEEIIGQLRTIEIELGSDLQLLSACLIVLRTVLKNLFHGESGEVDFSGSLTYPSACSTNK
jgi:hypothetical protein